MLKTAKKQTWFRPLILSRHPTHDPLRLKHKLLPLLKFRSVIRLGSTTEVEDKRIELNNIQSIKNSANKLLMKQCFTEGNIITADWAVIRQGAVGLAWCNYDFHTKVEENRFDSNFRFWENNGSIGAQCPFDYPIVAKHIFGSRGNGNYKLNNQEELESWLQGKTLSNYIFEKFYNYSREYRLHVSKDGCFYTCRKMLKSDTPEDKRWFRNDSNSSWIIESNEAFDKPVNWDTVIAESVKALKAVGLDFGAVDLRIQSKLDKDGKVRENPDFIVVEINSAPSFGKITLEKYLEVLPKLLKDKYETSINS